MSPHYINFVCLFILPNRETHLHFSCSFFRFKCLRKEIVCLSAQRAARPAGQHHEGDRPASRQSFANALCWRGQPSVRAELPGGD